MTLDEAIQHSIKMMNDKSVSQEIRDYHQQIFAYLSDYKRLLKDTEIEDLVKKNFSWKVGIKGGYPEFSTENLPPNIKEWLDKW